MPKPQPNKIEEMELQALIRVMRAFGIQSEPVVGRNNTVRFMESPYNPFVEDCRSVQVPAHNRGTHVCPLVIKAIIDKFGIREQDFIAQVVTDSERFGPSAPPSGSGDEDHPPSTTTVH